MKALPFWAKEKSFGLREVKGDPFKNAPIPSGLPVGGGTAGLLRGMRPEVSFGDIWCAKCNAACDFEETATHKLWSSKDGSGNHRGTIFLRASCHGEHEDIALTFEQFRGKGSRKIVAFSEASMEIE